ncbi:MAG: isoprenylcysteine carboxylmethyltransferase family protein [Alphaproteobacteria bacterium]
MNAQAQLILGLLWLSFGAVHSVTASPAFKRRVEPKLGGLYRVVYNIAAGVHLAAILSYEYFSAAGSLKFDRPWFWSVPAIAAEILGWLIILFALGQYDMGRFLGLTQMREHARKLPPSAPEPLVVDGMHRYVRHPLYAGLFLVLWGRVSNELELATALWASLYLLIGTYFEERKLLREFGPAYATYRARVPAFVPWRGHVKDGPKDGLKDRRVPD